jgi:lysozyme family protein
MAKIDSLATFIKKWEGGFANDPLDAGGATMAGITIATFTQYRQNKGMPVPSISDLKNISMAEWTDILLTYYWQPWQADRIASQAVANLLVGWGWGSGVKTAIVQFQKLGNLTADGIVGEKTLAYINSAETTDLFNKIWLARKDFFVNIVKAKPTQIKFLAGWLNRLYDNISYNYKLVAK